MSNLKDFETLIVLINKEVEEKIDICQREITQAMVNVYKLFKEDNNAAIYNIIDAIIELGEANEFYKQQEGISDEARKQYILESLETKISVLKLKATR